MKNVIYKIVNLVNDKFYVGSTNDSKIRFRQHRKLLRQGRHHCKHLQASWNKYGEAKFSFVVVDHIESQHDLQAAEDSWLVAWVGKPECYNAGLRSGAPWRGVSKEQHPNFGKSVSARARENTSKTLKAFYAADYNNHPRVGKQHSEETKAQISKNRKGRMAGADHYRFGQTVSEEIRRKIGGTQRGKSKAPRVITEAGRAKIRAAAEAGHYASFKGKHHTEESRKLMGEGIVVRPSGQYFDTITEMRSALGVSISSVHRALKTDKPIASGMHKGLSFQYQDPEREAARVRLAAELSTTTPKKRIGRPAGQTNRSQVRKVLGLPEEVVYDSIADYIRKTGRSRKSVYEVLSGVKQHPVNWTVRYV